jgi:glycerol-3-phosphate dehydrogenase (NAD+)
MFFLPFRGSAIAKIVGNNLKKLVQAGRDFELKASMWVFEELIEGRKLTEIINETHENVKYN